MADLLTTPRRHGLVAPPQPTTTALAHARNVGRSYRRGDTEVVAVADATCTIMPGDRIALVGPSGSGKSTLLHLLAGLDTPTSGELTWPALGERATLRPQKISVVFQSPSLLPQLSVIENVELPLLLVGSSTSLARAAARDTLARINLADLADKLPEELSGGQAQRVALARALVMQPRLMLADEPTGQLDHPTAQQVFDELFAALDGTDTALVVATHDRAIAERLQQSWRMAAWHVGRSQPMITSLWLSGLLARRPGRLLGAVVGVACTVALLVALGAFVSSSAATMTRRAVAAVPVDWQVLLAPGVDPATATQALHATTPTRAVATVGYVDVAGLTATTGGTVQTTGAGKVLGVDATYRQHFPSELRLLVGSLDGVLVAQQTAANLHAGVGDTVTIQRVGLPPVDVKVNGVVDLPYADLLFQAVGVPAGTAPQAPPDNVLLLPAAQWHTLFDPQVAARPDSVRTQLHVRLAQDLPSDPGAAFIAVQQLAHNFEARIAGSGVVGDNLTARLDGARADALYARVLFLFIGLPGAVLALLLTAAIVASGGGRRRQEQALLRVRGATTAQVLRLESVEALLVSIGGMLLGLLIAALAVRFLTPDTSLFDQSTWRWTLGASIVGLALAIGTVLAPAWRQARHSTVAAGRQVIGRARPPLWQRWYLDVIVLAIAAVMFWRTASTGYQLVLAPEGVPQTSVSYEAFLAPLGLWIGVGLLALRLWNSGLEHGGRVLRALFQPFAHGLSGIVADAMGRQRVLLTHGIVLVALAFAFAVSVALFNTTYAAQARVDAELTNGADVQVSGMTAGAPGSMLAQLAALPGVAAAQPLQHRFAYVGTDLQDIFGINPQQIGSVTHMANAYFANGDAQATLAKLSATPDGGARVRGNGEGFSTQSRRSAQLAAAKR